METVSFSLKNASKVEFDGFMKKLRTNVVLDPQRTSHDIPVLYNSVADSKRYVLIKLDNYGDDEITVPIDVLNLYVVGHLGVGKDGHDCFYYLNGDPKVPNNKYLFPDVKQRKVIPFTGNYPDLQRYAKENREDIDLGASPLDNAIRTLKGYRGDSEYKPIAKSFLVIIQMVAEVARYGFIQRQIGDKIGDGEFKTKPGFKTMGLQNGWSALSLQIQKAPLTTGKFVKDVVLKDEANKNVTISNVNDAVKFCDISMLLYQSTAEALLLLLEQQEQQLLHDQVN